MSGSDGNGARRATRRQFLQAGAAVLAVGALPLRASARGARVVVVGGGFAGAACALALKRGAPEIDVTLVDAAADYVTGPMSNAVLAGWRSIASVTVSRAGLARAGVRIVRDSVAAIDAGKRVVHAASGATLGYERLVVAPGIRFLPNSPQGYDQAAAQRMPHAWIPGTQTMLLAAQLRAMDNGGIVAISVPPGLMRCPPGPFERASVIAAWLRKNKPRSKILIFDANNHFPRQDVFATAWKELYPGMIDWIASTDGGAVERVDAQTMTLYTARGAQRAAVANVIPAQAAGQLAVDAGLASGHGWCPVAPATFESTLIPDVHVIGDACAAGAMPKSASAAHSQAQRCARAVIAALHGRAAENPELDSVCYSFLAPDRALAIHGRFAIGAAGIEALPLPSPTRAPSAREEAQLAAAWYRQIVADSFGS